MAKADDLKARIGLSGPPLTHIRGAPPAIPDHEMVRRIGQGSYGEVWLARNAVGTCRAVKVVYRDNFKDARPYEREFSGIQKYEPISRSNEGLVDVLQIGRNDAEGYFYYIMELADDGSLSRLQPEEAATFPTQMGEPRPDRLKAGLQTYTPRTLSREIHTRGRLPYEECITLGLTLNLALGHLHRQGLIHRDVKPSNIIFVNGVPKLADIGLVTDSADAQSFVGTEGFIPPEGPNSPQADIFALGKVLYEASMGKDRQEFPEPFTSLGLDAESKALMELNAVLLKACAANPKQRYESAEDMNADLALLHSGKSVKHKHAVERQLARLTKLSLAGAALAVIAAAAYVGSLHEARIAQANAKAEARQRQRAEEGERKARESAADSKAVLDFLKNKVLAAARPEGQEGGLGQDVTLRRALEEAEPQIAVLFTNRPMVEAQIRDALGDTFDYLSDYTNAIQQYERAVALAKVAHPQERDDLFYMRDLAIAYEEAGRASNAVALMQETLERARSQWGADHTNTIDFTLNLAEVLSSARQFQKALSVYEEALRLSRAKLGPNDRYTFRCMAGLAEGYSAAGLFTESVPRFEETLRLQRDRLGLNDRETLRTMNDLAVAYRHAGRRSESLPMEEDLLSARKANFGSEDVSTIQSMNNLAVNYRDAGRLSEALPLFEEALRLSKSKLGPDHPTIVVYMNNLASEYEAGGRLSETIPMLEQGMKVANAKLRPDDLQTLVCMGRLGRAYLEANRLAEGESLLRHVLDRSLKSDSLPVNTSPSATVTALGTFLSRQGRYSEAEALLREWLPVLQKKDPGHSGTFDAESSLGSALLCQEKYAEAEPLLLHGYEGLKRRDIQRPDPAHAKPIKEAGERLVQLYRDWGKPGQADEWRQKLAEGNTNIPRHEGR